MKSNTLEHEPMKSIFLTYNQGSQIGKNTVLRMQTISNLYGLTAFLPVRAYGAGSGLDEETQRRIRKSPVVVAFALDKLTRRMKAELTYAIHQKKAIVVIYDQSKSRTLTFKDYKNVMEEWIDYDQTEDSLHNVSEFLDEYFAKKEKGQGQLGTAIVGVGLGLLALWALSKST
ncbi:MAG: hypothetical protein AAF804_08540 [Bacteroidota bacterium]